MTEFFSPAAAAFAGRSVRVFACVALLLSSGCRSNQFPDYPAGYREFAYVANAGSDTVTVLDLVYLRIDRTLSVRAHPIALIASPVRDEVYVLSGGVEQTTGALSVIDTRQNKVVASIPVERDPRALAIDPSGARAYVSNAGSNSISVVDLGSRHSLFTVPTSAAPGSLRVAPDDRTLVVALPGAGSVALFAIHSPVPAGQREGAAEPTAPLTPRATFSGCPGAASPVILPDSSKAFLACSGSNQVLALSLAEAAGTWAARQDSSLLEDHRVALLDTGRDPENLTLKPDGGEIFVSNTGSGSVSEIATQSNEVGSTYPIGNRPTHGIVSGDNSALWISDSGADSLSLYSISDGKLVSSIRTGNAPGALAFSADEHLLLVADQTSGDVAIIRTTSRLGPALFTLMPAGATPSALAVKAMQSKR